MNTIDRTTYLDVDAAGVLYLRTAGEVAVPGTLPLVGEISLKEAERLQVRHGRLARDRSGRYVLNDVPKEIEDIYRTMKVFEKSLEEDRAERRKPKLLAWIEEEMLRDAGSENVPKEKP